MSSHRSEYPAIAPDCRSPSRFPGSRNAMLIRNPGPVNRHSCLHENGGTVLQSTPSAVSDSISIAAIFSSRDSYSIPASSSSSFSAFPSANGNVDGGEDERRLRYSSSSGEFKGAVDSSNGAELIISLSPPLSSIPPIERIQSGVHTTDFQLTLQTQLPTKMAAASPQPAMTHLSCADIPLAVGEDEGLGFF
nr:hypothetical protein Iba_chr01eCG3920 [Ipomoea batatas]